MKSFAIWPALGLVATFFAFSTASAQTSAPAPAAPAAQAPVDQSARRSRIMDEEGSEIRGNSRRARDGKSIVLTAQPVGFGPVALVTQGLSAGFFVDRDSLIQVDFNGNSNEDYTDSHHIRVRALSVSWKQFLGNSFYIKGGLEHRWIRESYADSFDSWSYRGTSTGMQFAVGNQWQINGFTLGCDWFGFNQALRHSRSNEITNGTGWAINDLDEESEDSLEGMTFKAAHFYLGFAF